MAGAHDCLLGLNLTRKALEIWLLWIENHYNDIHRNVSALWIRLNCSTLILVKLAYETLLIDRMQFWQLQYVLLFIDRSNRGLWHIITGRSSLQEPVSLQKLIGMIDLVGHICHVALTCTCIRVFSSNVHDPEKLETHRVTFLGLGYISVCSC